MSTSTSETNKHIVIVKRKFVKELKAKHFNKTQIQKKLAVSPAFVRRWWDGDTVESDYRGWPKGKARALNQLVIDRVLIIRETLIKKKAIFYGQDSVQREYQRKFPAFKLPSRSSIARVLKTKGLVKHYRKKVKGGSVYQHYPAQTILTLGKVVQEVDFTGNKILKGYEKPLHFFTQVYLRPFKLPFITRISSPSGQEAADKLIAGWKKYPLPAVLKLDNDTAFYAAGKHADLWLSRFICWLLNLGIIPVFSAFNKPWNNGSVEGINSVFVKKIWLGRYHSTLTELDRSIAKFNHEYAQRIKGKLTPGLPTDYFINLKTVNLMKHLNNPTIYFTRQVEMVNDTSCIRVLKVPVKLPNSYLKQFVLAKLNVYKKKLTVYYEIDSGKLQIIRSLKFPVKYY